MQPKPKTLKSKRETSVSVKFNRHLLPVLIRITINLTGKFERAVVNVVWVAEQLRGIFFNAHNNQI
jgi:hypothetical protein